MRPAVLHLCSSLGMYGAEQALLTLARGMRSSEYRPVIGVFDNSRSSHTELAAEARKRGIPAAVFPCAGRFDLRTVRLIRNFVAEHDLDIVHSHGYKSNLYGFLATLRTRTRRVATCHNWTNATWRLGAYSRIDKRLLRRFDRIVTVSDRIGADLAARGIPAGKIVRINNGIEVERFGGPEDGGEALRNELGIPPDGRVVGTVGRLSPEKGLRFLLRAAEKVLRDCPRTVFLIVGDGPERESLVRLGASLGLKKNLVFTGLRSDVERVYPIMDVFVLPSLDEGLPMVLLEAMASRRAVVSTAVGAIPGVIVPGESGMLVPAINSDALATAISSLLKDDGERSRLGTNARQRIEKEFSSRKMTDEYLAVYGRVLAAGPLR